MCVWQGFSGRKTHRIEGNIHSYRDAENPMPVQKIDIKQIRSIKSNFIYMCGFIENIEKQFHYTDVGNVV